MKKKITVLENYPISLIFALITKKTAFVNVCPLFQFFQILTSK